MKQNLTLLLIPLFVGVAFFINHSHSQRSLSHSTIKQSSPQTPITSNDNYPLQSVNYLETYIEDIINHGSSQNLGFAYGDMEGGFADKEAAKKIAAYVVTLSGKQPTHPEWVKEGRTFYISNCGGCHGEDGKGIHGTFPDLTRKTLLGIARRIND